MKSLRAFSLFIASALLVSAAPQPIKILQVEETRDNAFMADDAVIPAGVKETKDALISLFPGVSSHATQVAERLLAHPENIAEIEIDQEGTYYGRTGVGLGRAQYYLDTEIYPKPTHGQLVENHSYGMVDLLYSDDGCAKVDRRAERDNVVIVVAIPDAGMGHVNTSYGPLEVRVPNCAKNIIAVGSGTGAHEILTGGRVDLVTDEQWTSYGAPKVAEVAADMIAEALGAGVSYRWDEVRATILQTADSLGNPAVFGAGRLNRAAALAAWRTKKGLPGAVAPAPAPVASAPVVVAPPPVVVVAPTAAELRAQAASTVGATYDAANHCFNGVNESSVSQLVSELQSRGL